MRAIERIRPAFACILLMLLTATTAVAQDSCPKTILGAKTNCIPRNEEPVDFTLNVFEHGVDEVFYFSSYDFQTGGTTYTVRDLGGKVGGDIAVFSTQETVGQWAAPGDWQAMLEARIAGDFKEATDFGKAARFQVRGGVARQISFTWKGSDRTTILGLIHNRRVIAAVSGCGKGATAVKALMSNPRRTSRAENEAAYARASRDRKDAGGGVSAAAGEIPQTLRAFAVEWDGFDKPVSGLLRLGQGTVQTLSMTLPEGTGQCTGTFEAREELRGVWFIRCENGLTASGSYLAHGAGKGSSGEGLDSEGRRVAFTIAGS